VIPDISLDIQALRDGFFYGFLLGVIAGGFGWFVNVLFSLWKTIVGR